MRLAVDADEDCGVNNIIIILFTRMVRTILILMLVPYCTRWDPYFLDYYSIYYYK